MKKIIFIIFIMLICTVGCSSANKSAYQSRPVEDFYIATGVQKYFLTELPEWANFDQWANCYRSSIIRYFDIDGLMKSYGLNFNKAIQLQANFNEELVEFIKLDKSHKLTIKEEELLFFKASEKVSSNILFFDPPSFNLVNLIWVDEIFNFPDKEKKLEELLNSNEMDKGIPVLMSFCHTRAELENKFTNTSAKFISAELFSVYETKGIKTPGFKIQLDQFFKPNQKINFYSQRKVSPMNSIKGTYKIINY